ncbi:MAG TPA: hypothetical protein VFG08_06050 [Candidatus Polarisedimenticolia bacterium]|nr:hypothetical protein [Candidatus Polarisedimenticolia bacterium]
MKLASELTAGLWVDVPDSLDALLARLDVLAQQPGFALQRELALSNALRSYLQRREGSPLAPLPQEVHLANLLLYADYYPQDGQLTLIEQLRDVVTEHIPEEERVWMDPLKHSFLDLLEIARAEEIDSAVSLTLHSLGDGRRWTVAGGAGLRTIPVGEVLLTRLIRDPLHDPEQFIMAGCALRLSAVDGQALIESVQETRRTLEMQSGSFALGEWAEFAKRYGQVLLWGYAQARYDALVEAVVQIRYVTPEGQPFLYSVALYDHHEFRFLCDGMAESKGFDPVSDLAAGEKGGDEKPRARTWVFRTPSLVARITVTPVQLILECDAPDRLEDLKHRLASTFGYALHFRGETTAPPPRRVTEAELAKAESYQVVVTPEEERDLLRSFLESVYLTWPDIASPSLGGETPRHAAADPAKRRQVADVIAQLERDDLGLRRTGAPAYDYAKLRDHFDLS